MTCVAVLQARSSSRRLPGKVVMPIVGAPMLARQAERVLRSRRIDQLVIATSTLASDDAVEQIAQDTGVACYRGALDDVLDRFHGAARRHEADIVVRLTGDCPLADPEVIDGCIDFFRIGNFDYASNALRPTWPDGLDVEVMTMASLHDAWHEAEGAADREHVTPFIHRHPDRFRLGSYEQGRDLSAMRWTVDEPSDFAFVSQVYEALWPKNPDFTTENILDLLARRPDLAVINSGIERNAGMKNPT